jgi:hypothetical protein
MSNALAIASVTAVLKNLLDNGLVDHGVTGNIGGDVTISALPPDHITTGADERVQLNLFLYQVTPNTGLRSPDRSSLRAPGNRPAALVLNLHYLLTAYGSQDLQIEILLGYALRILQHTPELKYDTIRTMLDTMSSTDGGRVVSPTVAALAASNLAEQVAELTITPQFLSIEDLSKIWSALQARYRPSATYKVSLVMIDG